MSDSLIVAAEGSAPYKLLEDAGRGILTAEALTSALKNGVPAAPPNRQATQASDTLARRVENGSAGSEPNALRMM